MRAVRVPENCKSKSHLRSCPAAICLCSEALPSVRASPRPRLHTEAPTEQKTVPPLALRPSTTLRSRGSPSPRHRSAPHPPRFRVHVRANSNRDIDRPTSSCRQACQEFNLTFKRNGIISHPRLVPRQGPTTQSNMKPSCHSWDINPQSAGGGLVCPQEGHPAGASVVVATELHGAVPARDPLVSIQDLV